MSPGTTFPAFLKLEYQRDNRAGGSFLADIDDTLGQAERRFNRFSAEAQRQIDTALSTKRNSFGSLDLGTDQLRANAAAQEARALAARELAAATRLVAKEEGDLSQKTRLAIAALEAQAREEEGAARAARSHAAALEQVQERLNRHASATDAVTTSTRRGTDAYGAVTNSLRANRVAMVQAGQQMQDMAIQFQAGTRTSTILAQQLPQLAFAFSGMGGTVGTVARILSGPWSIALVAGSALLGGFIDSLIRSEDAADKGGSAMSRLANKLDLSKNSYESLMAVVNEYNQAQDKSTALTYQAIIAAEKQAVANLAAAKATLALYEAEASRGPTGPNGQGQIAALGAASVMRDRITQLEKDLAGAQIAASQSRSDIANDPRKQIEIAYNAELVRYQEKLKQGLIDQATLNRVNLRLDQDRIAALKAYDEAHRKSTASGSRDLATFGLPVAGARITSGYGTRVAPTAGASTNHLGIDYAAPIGTPVRAAMDGLVKFAGMVNGYGNQIELSHGGGTASRYSHLSGFAVQDGKRVNKGDVIGYVGKTGTATGPHLHYEVLVNGKKVDPSKGQFPVDPTKVAEDAERAAATLSNFGENAAEKIARINDRFNEQPRLIDAARASTAELDATIKDLSERKPAGFEALIADAQTAKGVIQDALIRPFEELEGDSERRLKIQRLITAGRDDEADALQTIWRLESQLGPIDEARKQAVLDIVRHEREVSEVLESRRTIIDAYLDATRSVRGELEAILSGQGNIANFQRIFQQMRGRILTEQLFGPALRELEKYVKQNTFGPAVDSLETETKRAGSAIGSLADEVVRAKNQIANPGAAGAGGTSLETAFDAAFAKSGLAATTAANDNGEIVVTAPRGTVMAMTPEAYILQLSEAIVKPTLKGMEGVFGVQFSAGLGKALTGAFSGYVTGGPIGAGLGLLSSIPGLGGSTGIFGRGLEGLQQGSLISGLASSFGIGLDGTGSQIGGAIGSFIPGIGSGVGSLVGGLIGGKNTGRTVGGLAGAAIGSIIPGIGTILGGLVGSLIGGLFGTRPRGGGSVTNTGVTASANDGGVTSSLNSMGGNLQTAIQRIADAMGATVGSYGVGIGRYRDYYQVSSNPNDPRLGNSYFGRDSAASLYDGLDAEAAMRAAILGALQDGAIRGIREGAQRLLAAGNDLDKQIQKAVDFQSVFTRLRAYTDPVGAALDKLNTEFQHLKDVFAEAGASAAEYAQLEQLYGIERAKAIDAATKQITGSLRSLYDELTIGDSGLSLRDRKANAQAAYNPLAARVAAGDVTAYDDFATAARTLLDIERQISGSQSGYFDLFNQVRDLTRTTLDAATATANAATGVPSPFSNAANDNAAVVTGLAGLQSSLDAVNQNLGTLILQGGVGGTIDLNGIYASRSWY